MTRRSDEQ
jgi:hypothetical protein